MFGECHVRWITKREVGHVFGRGQAQTRQDLARAEFGESMDHFRLAATHAAGGIGATVGPRMGMARGRMGSAREYVGPGAERLRGAASQGWDTTIAFVTPIADAARQGAIRATKLPDAEKRRGNGNGNGGGRTSATVASIVAAGAAIGATGALVARKRNRARWAEYEPSALQDEADALVDETRAANRERNGRPRAASKMAGWARDHGMSVDSVQRRIQDARGGGGSRAAGVSGDAMRDTGRRSSGMTDTGMGETGMGGMPGEMTDEMRDAMSEPKPRGGDTAHHLADKADAKLNDASTRRGSKASGKSSDPATGATADEVDDVLRSSKDRHRR
jgi:hypothetical protein